MRHLQNVTRIAPPVMAQTSVCTNPTKACLTINFVVGMLTALEPLLSAKELEE